MKMLAKVVVEINGRRRDVTAAFARDLVARGVLNEESRVWINGVETRLGSCDELLPKQPKDEEEASRAPSQTLPPPGNARKTGGAARRQKLDGWSARYDDSLLPIDGEDEPKRRSFLTPILIHFAILIAALVAYYFVSSKKSEPDAAQGADAPPAEQEEPIDAPEDMPFEDFEDLLDENKSDAAKDAVKDAKDATQDASDDGKRRIVEALEVKVDVEGGEDADLALDEWIASVRAQLRAQNKDVNIVFDTANIEDAIGPPSSLEVRERLSNVSLRDALKIVLRAHDLDFGYFGGALYITTQEEAETNPEVAPLR